MAPRIRYCVGAFVYMPGNALTSGSWWYQDQELRGTARAEQLQNSFLAGVPTGPALQLKNITNLKTIGRGNPCCNWDTSPKRPSC